MTKESKLTHKQLKTIELLATGSKTCKEIAELVGIHPNTITKWRRIPEFAEAVVCRSRELLKESLPEVYSALTNKSKKGNDRHIKIFLEHLEKLEEARSTQASITFTWKGSNTNE